MGKKRIVLEKEHTVEFAKDGKPEPKKTSGEPAATAAAVAAVLVVGFIVLFLIAVAVTGGP